MTDLSCTRCGVDLEDDPHFDDFTQEPFCLEHCSCFLSDDSLLDTSDDPVGMLPAGSLPGGSRAPRSPVGCTATATSVDGAPCPLGAGSTAGGADAAHDAAHAPAVGDIR